jgi:hypothetical protein
VFVATEDTSSHLRDASTVSVVAEQKESLEALIRGNKDIKEEPDECASS